MIELNNSSFHKAFCSSEKNHVLMITNHGIHQWDIIPGLPDTGGQNVFVNQFTETLAAEGYKITIVNRGGYAHPVTGEMHTGLVYVDENRRILYIEDNVKEFVRKEDMVEHVDTLADNLYSFLQEEGLEVNLIVSHYWDGAQIGALLNKKFETRLKHIWIPHSTGALKKSNVKKERWEGLRVDERIKIEKQVVRELDSIAYTSFAVQESLRNDYRYRGGIFLPPCIVVDRFHPETVSEDNEIWDFLSGITGLEADKIKDCKIITEISRTDTTKRKDILINAFAKVHKKNPNTFLVVAIDETEEALADELKALIREHGLEKHVAPIGNEWERMPTIYRITDVYCSPSIMEGFGMSVQEAAATKVPVVASSLIPFATEFLLGETTNTVIYEGGVDTNEITAGAGAIVVSPDEINGFAKAISMLVQNDTLRKKMGELAYSICIPYFTWQSMIRLFLESIECEYYKKKANSIAS